MELVELTDAELDAVAAGQGVGNGGLVGIGVDVTTGAILSHNDVDVTLTNVANDVVHHVGVGVAVAAGILGAAGAGNFIAL